MNFTFDSIVLLKFCLRLVGILFIVQNLEFLFILLCKKNITPVYWEHIHEDFSKKRHISFLNFFLNEKIYISLLLLGIIASTVTVFSGEALFAPFMLCVHLYSCFRWRGAFNGGSDYMTVQVLLPISFCSLIGVSEKSAVFSLYYISMQAALSYFIAGVYKLKTHSWRTGTALMGFYHQSLVLNLPKIFNIQKNIQINFFLSWITLLFEILFPIAFLNHKLMMVFLVFGFCFHFGNFLFFGLNRFLFVWVSAYPAMLFTSVQIEKLNLF